jgi:hypothetical protein
MVLTLGLFFSNQALLARDIPSDVCTMLSGDQLAKVLKQPYHSTTKRSAPAVFRGSPTGTDCTYQATNAPSRVLLFRIYVESSPDAAKQSFDRFRPYSGPSTTVAGNWDSAYIDPEHAIHVQKGKVRYYLALDPVRADKALAEKRLQDLAAWVAGQF